MVKKMTYERSEYDLYIPHDPVKLDTGSETIVEQCHEETTNINKIIGRYRQSGVLPEHRQGDYVDSSNVGELMDIKMMQSEMQKNYENLPDFIKEKLPLADIGNVSDETLQEIFNNEIQKPQQHVDNQGNEGNGSGISKDPGESKGQSSEIKESEKSDFSGNT